MSKPNGIVAMNPEKYREMRGIASRKPKKHLLPRPHPKQVIRHSLPHQHRYLRWTPTQRAGILPMTSARRCPSWAALSPRQRVRKPLSPHPVKLPLYRPFACRAAQAPARM